MLKTMHASEFNHEHVVYIKNKDYKQLENVTLQSIFS